MPYRFTVEAQPRCKLSLLHQRHSEYELRRLGDNFPAYFQLTPIALYLYQNAAKGVVMQGLSLRSFTQNFLGQAPEWYKLTIVGFLMINPLLLLVAGPYIAGWVLVLQFILP